MPTSLRTWHLEDIPVDHLPVRKAPAFHVPAREVFNALGKENFDAAIIPENFDLILSDLTIPDCDCLSTLALWRANYITLAIATERVSIKGASLRNCPCARTGHFICLSVRDPDRCVLVNPRACHFVN